MSYFSKFEQNVQADTLNSSTVNVDAGATFNGALAAGTSTLGIAGIQVNLFTTQNCMVCVDQSMDNSHWDITDCFNYYHTLRGMSFTVQATASYVRVRVTNLGLIATTEFRLQTALCPIVEAVPRALDEDGFFKTCVEKIHGKMGKVRISPMGSMKTSDSVRLVGTVFNGSTIDSNFWITSATAAGATSQANGEMTLTTGATANGSAKVESSRVARYIAGSPNYYRAQIVAPTVTTVTGTNTRRWGAYDANNGYFFELTKANGASTTVLGIGARKGASDTVVTSFNGDYGLTYDVVDGYATTYEIWWTNKSAYFFVNDIHIHTITGLTATTVATTSLKVSAECINLLNNNAANTLVSRVMSISRLGEATTRPHWRYIAGALPVTVLKYGPGTLHVVTCNKHAGTSITLYDALSATNPICIIDPSTGSKTFDLDFYTGLTVVTVGSGIDCTIIYE